MRVSRSTIAVALGGAALAAAFPKVGLHLLVWVSIVPLLVVVRGRSPLRALGYGVLFGVVFRAGTLYWLVFAMTRYGGLPVVAALAGAAAVVLYTALYWGLLALVASRVTLSSATAPIMVAATWTGLEYVQTWLFSGFPWALVGYAAGATTLLVQVADLAGVYGLGFLAVAVNAALAGLLIGWERARVPVALVATLMLLATAYGAVRVAGANRNAQGEDSLTVGLVQGNVAQDLKWDAASKQANLERHLSLSRQSARAGADLVLWPESSWPDMYGVERDAVAARLLAELARNESVALVVGTVHLYQVDHGYEVTNAAVLVDRHGDWRGRYEKVHLVPFGEYLPLQRFLRFLGPLVQAVGALRAGDRGQPLLAAQDSGVPPFGLGICYEIIFPAHARDAVRRGARFLATISNDAWYGTTSGPYQHFAMARLRAVETRRYVVRAANTGISGIVDPWGRVVQRSDLEQEAVITGRVEARDGMTLYVRTGDALAFACMLVGAVAVLGVLWPRAGFLYGPRGG